MRVVYLAHQLSAPTREGIEANRLSAARWAVWISQRFRVAVSADWIWMTGELEETRENREWGLACDLAHIARCDAVWLVGPSLSSGMILEADSARQLGKPVYDLVRLVRHEELVRVALHEQGWRDAA